MAKQFRSITINLHKKIISQMNKTMSMITELMAEMAILKKEDGKLELQTLYFTEYWLAERLGVSREWISKCICRLEELGLIKVIRKRKEGGKWATNLYRAGHELLRILGLWRAALQALLHRVNSHSQEVAYSNKEKRKMEKNSHLNGKEKRENDNDKESMRKLFMKENERKDLKEWIKNIGEKIFGKEK